MRREDLPARCAEIGSGLLHGGVEVGEAGLEIEEHDGVEVQGLDEDDADRRKLPIQSMPRGPPPPKSWVRGP